ncbi:MAG: Cobalamin B12-binding domain-containing protein [Candidatus Magnetoglobus multicellularis str. Araruama]|uniref:Cobalamin B12-binding domain-containing protein n=1 Tax=Candidatus Magnetoglobus multicellularis str. Araruama TaxID=890399 RepID=A0A1V1PBB1_9BACT|nr:MAG: Cobalamin B12-binding domain-containing protein [Candidatus Magnetoglobus multicellularis str. Araruama]
MIEEHIYKEYLSSLITGKRAHCHEIVNNTKDKTTIQDLYTQLFQESLYEVGRLWEYNQVSVAVEHMATAITESLMNTLYTDIIQSENKGFRAIISSAQNEYHQVGAKMVADMFEMHGWDTCYLGANTPTNELIHFANTFNPHVIAISLSIYFHLSVLTEMIQTIRKKFKNCPILIGGQAFKHGNGADYAGQFSDVLYVASLDQLEKYILTLEKQQ